MTWAYFHHDSASFADQQLDVKLTLPTFSPGFDSCNISSAKIFKETFSAISVSDMSPVY